jgi:hypothetical protein
VPTPDRVRGQRGACRGNGATVHTVRAPRPRHLVGLDGTGQPEGLQAGALPSERPEVATEEGGQLPSFGPKAGVL